MGKKTIPEAAIPSWEEADRALRQIGEIEIEVEKKEGLANLKINDIKEKLSGELNGKLARKSRLEKNLEEFFEARQAEVAPAKSRKLNFGALGIRTNPSKLKLLGKNTWEKVVAKIQELNLGEFLRFPDPEPDKEKIKGEADGKTLQAIGVRVCSNDEFWYEVDREKIENTDGEMGR